MAILLIGSTGSGKSTLGNFLLGTTSSDRSILEKNESLDSKTISNVFETAISNMPQTQAVETATLEINGCLLKVMDTPGLNESASKDLSHIIDMIQSLHCAKEVIACIFVIKFNSKIDMQYKSTVKYYRELLPGLFSRNVVVVLTDFASDKRSVLMRKRQGIIVDLVKHNTIKEMKECGNLTHEPQLFMIDSVPMDDKELQHSLQVRAELLEHVLKLSPILVNNLKVAKTHDLIVSDKKEMAVLKAEIEVYNEQLLLKTKTLHKKEAERSTSMRERSRYQSCIADLDTTELVEAASSWVDAESESGTRWYTDFDVESQWPIRSVVRCGGSGRFLSFFNFNVEWSNYHERRYRVIGRVTGTRSERLYASITLYTWKKDKFADDIRQYHRYVGDAQSFIEKLNRDISLLQSNCNKLNADIALKQEKIAHLSSMHLSINDAIERLKKYLYTYSD